MITDHKPEYLISLVHELRKLPQETEWVEFDSSLTECPREWLQEGFQLC